MKRKKIIRASSGFSLVPIMVFGAFAIAMLVAILPLVLTVTKLEGSGRRNNELRNAAELGIDYGIKQLNDYPAGACPIDLKTSDVPTSYLHGYTSDIVTIRISRLAASDSLQDWTNFKTASTIYSDSFDSVNAQAPSYGSSPKFNIKSGDYWRVIESTAQHGIFSRSIKVFLEPVFYLQPGDKNWSEYQGSNLSNAQYFQNAFLGNSGVNLLPSDGGSLKLTGKPPLTIDGQNYSLSVQSNRDISMNNVDLEGNLRISNAIAGAPSLVATATGSNLVQGTIDSNGAVNPLPQLPQQFVSTIGPTPSPGDNVLASAAPRGLLTNPVNPGANAPQIIPPAAQADNGATSLANFSNDVNQTSFVTPSLQSSGDGSTLSIEKSTKIFIKDGQSSADAMNINASEIKNSVFDSNNAVIPSALQIWYGGTRAITINLDADFNGLIYAPNAPITLKGSKNFSGALVGDIVSIKTSGSNSTIKIDTTVQSSSSSNGLGFRYLQDINGNYLPLGYKAVSWKEYPGRIIP